MNEPAPGRAAPPRPPRPARPKTIAPSRSDGGAWDTSGRSASPLRMQGSLPGDQVKAFTAPEPPKRLSAMPPPPCYQAPSPPVPVSKRHDRGLPMISLDTAEARNQRNSTLKERIEMFDKIAKEQKRKSRSLSSPGKHDDDDEESAESMTPSSFPAHHTKKKLLPKFPNWRSKEEGKKKREDEAGAMSVSPPEKESSPKNMPKNMWRSGKASSGSSATSPPQTSRTSRLFTRFGRSNPAPQRAARSNVCFTREKARDREEKQKEEVRAIVRGIIASDMARSKVVGGAATAVLDEVLEGTGSQIRALCRDSTAQRLQLRMEALRCYERWAADGRGEGEGGEEWFGWEKLERYAGDFQMHAMRVVRSRLQPTYCSEELWESKLAIAQSCFPMTREALIWKHDDQKGAILGWPSNVMLIRIEANGVLFLMDVLPLMDRANLSFFLRRAALYEATQMRAFVEEDDVEYAASDEDTDTTGSSPGSGFEPIFAMAPTLMVACVAADPVVLELALEHKVKIKLL